MEGFFCANDSKNYAAFTYRDGWPKYVKLHLYPVLAKAFATANPLKEVFKN
jgi:hypothetical protein